jgi:predicted Fe-S protein YdhL (DUF1289 family)
MGICSTTYGDLVCRGCKRFAHEVVEWNGYDGEQRETIWQRLEGMRGQVVGRAFMIVDISTYLAFCRSAHITTALGTDALYDVLAALVSTSGCLSCAGLALKEHSEFDDLGTDPEALAVMKSIDAVIYGRALANYERNFRVSPA